MGKKHDKKKQTFGWEDIIQPVYMPHCPECGSIKHVIQCEDEPYLFICRGCENLDFVVVKNGQPITVEDLDKQWQGYMERRLGGSTTYRLGTMVEDNYATG